MKFTDALEKEEVTDEKSPLLWDRPCDKPGCGWSEEDQASDDGLIAFWKATGWTNGKEIPPIGFLSRPAPGRSERPFQQMPQRSFDADVGGFGAEAVADVCYHLAAGTSRRVGFGQVCLRPQVTHGNLAETMDPKAIRDRLARLLSMRARLVLFALVCALPALLLAVLQLHRDTQRIHSTAIAAVNDAADSLERRLGFDLVSAESVALAIGDLDLTQPGARAACSASLQRALAAARPRITNYFVAAPSGDVVCSGHPVRGVKYAGDHPHVRQALQTERPVVSSLTVGRVTGQDNVQLVVPLLDSNGKVTAVAVAGLAAALLVDELPRRSHLPLTLTLLDRQGVLVSRSPASGSLNPGLSVSGSELFRQRMEMTQGATELNGLDGVRRLYASRAVRFRGETVLWIVSGAEVSVLEAAERSARWADLTVVLLMAVAVVGIAVALFRPLVLKRYQGLLDVAAQVSRRRYDSRVPVTVRDDITPVETALNEMLGAIEADREELEGSNRALQGSEQRHRSLFEHNPDAAYSLDRNGNVVDANEAFERLTGYTAAEVVSKDFSGNLAQGEEASFEVNFQRALAGEPVRYETVHLHKNGQPIDLDVNYQPIRVRGCITGVFGIAKDITERNRNAEALRKQQEFLAVLIENVTDGIVACSAEGVITHFNRATREWHGLAAEPIPAERWAEHFDLYLPDGRTRMTREQVPLFRALEEGFVRDAEMVIAPRIGPTRRVLSNGQALYDAAGVKTGAVVAMRDITEERRAEESIRVQAHMLDNIGQAVIATDLAGRITYTNRFAQNLYGWTSDEMNGRSILDLTVTQTTRSEALQIMAQLERGEDWRGEFLVHRQHGADFLAAVTNTALRDRCGALVGIVGISEDISERKQAEAALRQQHAMLTNAQRVAGMGLWELDVARNHLVWSEETHRIFGIAKEDFDHSMEAYLALVHPEDVPWMTERYARPASDSSAVELEYRIIRPDGEERVLQERGEITSGAAGQPIRKSGVVMDITERRREQDALRSLNAQLEARVLARTAELNQSRIQADQANQAKSTFLATMSHEIRTPMNGVIGMLDVLQQTRLEGDQIEMVDLIRESAGSLLAIIEDILDFSKIEAGRMEIEQQPLQLASLLEKVRGMLHQSAQRRRVRLAVFIDPAIPQTLLGDETRLRQLVVNLVGNAIKFSGGQEREGDVSVRATRVLQSAPGVMIDLIVTDNGIGMEEAAVARLFKPFEQADASTTRRFGGSGLGLAISAMLVRLMGGTLSASSAPGKGSTFTARLVLSKPALPQPDAAGDFGSLATAEASRLYPHRRLSSSAPRIGNPPTHRGSSFEASANRVILVAEDNEINQVVIARQLTLIGFEFEIAVDGRKALERWRRGGFALLLTDLHMPEMDGYALATAIRAEECGNTRIPIIALTANALRDEELRCLAVGMDAYLTKPIRLPQLKAAIECELDATGYCV